MWMWRHGQWNIGSLLCERNRAWQTCLKKGTHREGNIGRWPWTWANETKNMWHLGITDQESRGMKTWPKNKSGNRYMKLRGKVRWQGIWYRETVINKTVLKNRVHNTSLAAKGALANRLQRRTACKSKMAARGPQNGRRGLERGLPLGFGALPSTFSK